MKNKSPLVGTKKIEIFIVDDHPVVRRGVAILVDKEGDMSVCGEAQGAQEALEKISSLKPDIVIADLGLQGMSGMELLRMLKQKYPRLPVLIMSMHDESLYAERVLKAGARGYIMKEESPDKIVIALRQILNGKIYISEKMAEEALEKVASGKISSEGSSIDVLSDRELDIYRMIGQGFGTNKIAEELCISPKTVESYREKIKEKLNLENSVKLVQSATLWVHRGSLN